MASTTFSSPAKGSLSIFICAATWGLFWIPLHYFDENGLVALWAVVGINIAASVIALPVAFARGEFKRDHIKWLLILGLGMGISNVLYFAGIILSDVVRVIFLFYLLPLWATLFSWVIYKEPIGRPRLIAIGIAVIGIWLLLGGGGWPVPQNLGDIFGLLSGIGWAFGLTMIRGRNDLGSFSIAASSLIVATIIALILGIFIHQIAPDIQPSAPSWEAISLLALPVFVFGMLIMWPTLLGQLWGARFVASTTAALLTMSEILLASISATFAGISSMSLISWIGAGFILIAILVDIWANKDA